MIVRWLTGFVDRPAAGFEPTVRFWAAATGSTLSVFRGWDRQFATLVPPEGDAFLRVQRVEAGPGGSHLDIHVDNLGKAVRAAEELGAGQRHAEDDLVVMTSPGGLAFCVVSHDGPRVRPPAVSLADPATATLVDQISIDAPPDLHDAEVGFWSGLFRWPLRPGSRPEFSSLERPDGMPIRVLFQRLDEAEAEQSVTAHLDFACADVATATEHHVALGASLVQRHERWTTLSDPSGIMYCLTDRKPDAGAP